MTIPVVYSSSDASAPVLTGQAGSVTALLDAILINGYGSKVAAGWSIAYTGTNLRSYKTGRIGTPRGYLYISDTIAQTDCLMRGYSIMNGVTDTYLQGTVMGNQFPLPTTLSFFPKSVTTDTTARKWFCIADNLTFYLYVDVGSIDGYRGIGAGEIYSYRPSDVDNWFIAAQPLACVNLGGTHVNHTPLFTTTELTTATNHVVLARNYSGFGGQIGTIKFHNGIPTRIIQPNQVDGAIVQSPLYLAEAGTPLPCLRGHLRGLYFPGASPDNTTIMAGTGVLTGKDILFFADSSFDITGTWDTN